MTNNLDVISAHEHATWQSAAETYAKNMSLFTAFFWPSPAVNGSGRHFFKRHNTRAWLRSG